MLRGVLVEQPELVVGDLLDGHVGYSSRSWAAVTRTRVADGEGDGGTEAGPHLEAGWQPHVDGLVVAVVLDVGDDAGTVRIGDDVDGLGADEGDGLGASATSEVAELRRQDVTPDLAGHRLASPTKAATSAEPGSA